MSHSFRCAIQADLPTLVAMLADDALGAQREQLSDPLPESYAHALAAIESDPNNDILLACAPDGRIVGFCQLTFIPNLT